MNQEITSYLAKGRLMFSVDQQVSEAKAQRTDYSKTKTSRAEENVKRAAESAGNAGAQAQQTVRNTAPKVGRMIFVLVEVVKNSRIVMAMDNRLFRMIGLFWMLQAPVLYAQTHVDIQEEATVSKEMEKYVRNNSLVTHLNGWRIAVATTTDRRLMEQTKTKFQAQFDYKVKWEYKEPYYYLRAGAFLTRTEASQALDVVKKKFPGAFLSMDKVAYEEL